MTKSKIIRTDPEASKESTNHGCTLDEAIEATSNRQFHWFSSHLCCSSSSNQFCVIEFPFRSNSSNRNWQLSTDVDCNDRYECNGQLNGDAQRRHDNSVCKVRAKYFDHRTRSPDNKLVSGRFRHNLYICGAFWPTRTVAKRCCVCVLWVVFYLHFCRHFRAMWLYWLCWDLSWVLCEFYINPIYCDDKRLFHCFNYTILSFLIIVKHAVWPDHSPSYTPISSSSIRRLRQPVLVHVLPWSQ